MTTDMLHGDLLSHLYWCIQEAEPVATAFVAGISYQWVMDQDWFNEVCKIAGYEVPAMGSSVYLLGQPVAIRPDGGVPHLEAA